MSDGAQNLSRRDMMRLGATGVAAAGLGGGLAVSIGPLFPMLVAVTGSSFALLVLTAVGIGLLASLAGLRHAVAVDPVLAFGGP